MADEKNDLGLGSISDSTPESVKQEADDLAKDILGILHKNGVAQILPNDELKDLMVDFSIYLVNRDHKILQHGIDVGRSRTVI